MNWSYVAKISSMSFETDSVTFPSCFHVVEHVPDDHLALAELARVLSPEGRAIINVPMTLGRWETVEFGYANPLLNDHYFDYGEDFTQRMLGAGFSGIAYQLSKVVPADEFERLRLQDEILYWVRAGVDARIVDHEGQALRMEPRK